MVVVRAGKRVHFHNGQLVTDDQQVIEKLRSLPEYGVQILEVEEDDAGQQEEQGQLPGEGGGSSEGEEDSGTGGDPGPRREDDPPRQHRLDSDIEVELQRLEESVSQPGQEDG